MEMVRRCSRSTYKSRITFTQSQFIFFLYFMKQTIDRKHILRSVLIIIGCLIVIQYLLDLVWQERLYERVATLWRWWPVILIVAKIASAMFPLVWWWPIYILSMSLYPLVDALVYMTIWNGIWLALCYWIWYKRWDSIVWRFIGKKNLTTLHTVATRLRTPWWFLLIRIVLLPVEDMLNYAAGMVKMNFFVFWGISMLVTTWAMFVFFVLQYGVAFLFPFGS